MVRACRIGWPVAVSEVDEAASNLICMDLGTATLRSKSVRGKGEEVVATSLIPTSPGVRPFSKASAMIFTLFFS